MKKTGFTLAEALVAMAIVGIVAAIVAPMINRFKPDENKILFLKVYDSIVSVANTVAGNTEIFPTLGDNGSGVILDYTEAPFYNETVTTFKNRIYGLNGGNKMCHVFSDAFNAYPDARNLTTNCDPSAVLENSSLETLNFTSPEGIDFYMYIETDSYYKMVLAFDVNGTEGPNCFYSATCREPDKFKVLISSNGHVIPSDSMAQKYLETRASLRKIKIDASEMPAEENSIPDAFQKEPI